MSQVSEILLALRKIKPDLIAKYKVRTLGLFGSAVRSDFNMSSDLDIIVDFDQPIGVEFIDLADYLEDKLQRRIDLVSRNGVKPKYYQAIEKEILYV
ncbi:MAG: nucleotidyltransferase family protein [Chitinophagaceae bacterium]